MATTMNSLALVGIGEALYDVFEDGAQTLGGAPLNFAIHAHQLASWLELGSGIVVSCINYDRRGAGIIDSLFRRGMSIRYVGKDSGHLTGLVSVFMRDGEPCYQIHPDAAWDYMKTRPTLEELAGRCHAVCFGSLAQRSPVSRGTIRGFLDHAPQAIRLYDVNLRQNTLTGDAQYSEEIVASSCQRATVIKANQSELSIVLELLGTRTPVERTIDGLRRGMETLLAHFPARMIVVTRGGEGTAALTREGAFEVTAPAITHRSPHPVGAGDACSAGIAFGMALGWDVGATMELANRMGADVAAHPAATPPLSEHTLEFARRRLQQVNGA